jgi:cation diffusion facilitator family transporter
MNAAAGALELTPAQRAQERSMLFALVMDFVMVAATVLSGVLGGSLTMLAESARTSLGYVLEVFTLVVLRRIHRGVLADLEYGAGKLEQIASVVIAAGMLLAAVWIAFNAYGVWSGARELGTPIGLAAAAIVGMVNLYVNLLAWDSVRRSLTADASLIMEAQLRVRWVKLFSTLVVSVGLTVSALSTDDVVVAWADSLGSLFVAGYMVLNALEVMRTSLPDLLDRSAGAAVAGVVRRALDAARADYEDVTRLRTRRSGRITFVEIELAFDPALSMAEVARRVGTLATAIKTELPHAEVSVVASAAAPMVENAPQGAG